VFYKNFIEKIQILNTYISPKKAPEHTQWEVFEKLVGQTKI
jgi:hypothetical protein